MFPITCLVFFFEDSSFTIGFQGDSRIRQSRTTERRSPWLNGFGKFWIFQITCLFSSLRQVRSLQGCRDIPEYDRAAQLNVTVRAIRLLMEIKRNWPRLAQSRFGAKWRGQPVSQDQKRWVFCFWLMPLRFYVFVCFGCYMHIKECVWVMPWRF